MSILTFNYNIPCHLGSSLIVLLSLSNTLGPLLFEEIFAADSTESSAYNKSNTNH